jgi:serine/threonine protein kinase, bacterial
MQTKERLNNRYEVIRELGDGGFGKTYLVRDCQMPSARECVLKQLKPVNNNPQMADMVQTRFQREAAILEHLGEHDQIPRLYAYFSEADRFYLVEEYVEGDTLTQKVHREGPQSEAMIRSMLISLLPAMVHVHQQKIVHRDIKPDNIILRKLDGKPVLLDFGAVKETMTTVMNAQGQSTHSIVVGTPGYMPAEQLAGRPLFSSDLYSLGLTAIYMLTGKIPQEMDSCPDTGSILWRGFDRSIQMHPQMRFSSAQEMFLALNALAIGMAMPHSATQISQPSTPSATVISSTPMPTPYNSNIPTNAAMPHPQGQVYAPAPVYMQPPSQAYPAPVPAGGEWKKAVMTGGIIGFSILMGAMVLKGQNVFANNSSNTSDKPQVEKAKDADADANKKRAESKPAAPSPEASKQENSAPTPARRENAQEVAASNADTNATVIGSEGDKNIRSGPGTAYNVAGSAYTGDRIKVMASSRDDGGFIWHKVYYPKSGTEGWVAAQLLRLDTGTSIEEAMIKLVSQSSSSRPSSPAPAASETNATVTGATGSKNVRSGPGTSNSVAFSVHTGDRVKIIDRSTDAGGYTWLRIYSPQAEASGWMAAQLIKTD